MKRTMEHSRTQAAWAAGAAVVLCLAVAVDAQARDLTVATWGGAQEKAHKEVMGPPFTKEKGIPVVYTTWNGTISYIRGQVQTKSVSTDVYPNNPWDVVAGCDEGLFEKLDPKELGVDPKDLYEGAIEPCGVATEIWSYLWGWNGDRHPEWTEKTGPQGVKDAFDLNKFPGRRGLRKRVYTTLEFGALADGISRGDIYKVLATPDGVKRAYAKLDTIKKNTLFADAMPQMPPALVAGEVDLAVIVNTHWYNAVVHEKKNFRVSFNDQVYSYNMWTIPKGSPMLKEAKVLLAYMMQPRKMADVANLVAYPPASKSALAMVNPDVRKNLATAHFKDELYVSGIFWAERLDSYTKEFQTWLAQ